MSCTLVASLVDTNVLVYRFDPRDPLKQQGVPLLDRADALLEAEALLAEFPVLYPNRETLRTAIRGAATYGLQWFDAHLWACAEVNGLDELSSEDFQHGRHYGSVRAVNPFWVASGRVSELPPLYAP